MMCIDTSIRWVVMSVYYIVDVNPLYTLIQSSLCILCRCVYYYCKMLIIFWWIIVTESIVLIRIYSIKNIRNHLKFQCLAQVSAQPGGQELLNPEGIVFFPMNFSSSLLLQLPRYQDFTVAGKTFEITPWPQPGWRPLDPGTGDEAHHHCLGQMWNMGCLDCEGWNDRRRFWSPMAGKKFKFNL